LCSRSSHPQLAARGYQHEASAHPDGGFRIVIRRESRDAATASDAPASVSPSEEGPAVVLDVREDLRSGNEPFAQIMATVRGLPAGHDLVLVTTFEPIPLHTALARQGLAQLTKQHGPEEWHTRFSRIQASAGGTGGLA
jgi:uncharacterized protein (DUF2249 family)